MNLPLIGPGYKGVSDKLNASRMVNLYLEPGGQGGEPQPALIGTPGLRDFTYTGTGVIRGMHVFNSVMYVVSGSSLYSVNSSGVLSASLGTLQTSSGRVSMSDNGSSPTGGDQIIIVDGTYAYIYYVSSAAWKQIDSPGTTTASGIAWNGSVFCVVGQVSGTAAFTSPDGITWTARTLPSASAWRAVAWNGSVFCAIADNINGTTAATSPDGITWTARTLPAAGAASAWYSISALGARFCTVSYNSNLAAWSDDGISWTSATLPATDNWISITSARTTNLFCVIAQNSNNAATSPNGVTWTARTLPSSGDWRCVASDGVGFLAVGAYPLAATSANGTTWVAQTLPISGDGIQGVSWNGNVWMVLDYGSKYCATSPDGAAWTTREMPRVANWNALAWNGKIYCAVSSASFASSLYSQHYDGGNLVRTDTDIVASTVCFLGGYFISDIGGGQWRVSDLYDGLQWDDLNKSTADASPDDLLAVISNHGELWLLGQSTTEVWYQSGIGNPPFARVAGGVLDYGCLARYSVAKGSNTIFWLGTIKNNTQGEPMGVVMASGYTIRNITPPAIIAQWRSYTTLTDAWGYCYSEDGHDFYVITFPTDNATWAYDITTDSWSERSYYTGSAYSPGRHLANTYAYFDSKHYVGSYLNGKIYEMSKAYHDDAGQPIDSFRTFQYIRDHGSLNNVVFNKFEVSLEVGQAQAGGICAITATSQKSDYSIDNGASWISGNMTANQTYAAIETNGHLYCAIPSNSSNSAATSTDGSNWSARVLPSAQNWKLIKWNGKLFLSVANGSNASATSPDGITWTAGTLPANDSWGALVWDGTKYLLYPSTLSGAYYTSVDGANWTSANYTGTSFAIVSSMVWNGSQLCVIGQTGGIEYPYVSTDGANWTRGTMPANATGWYGLAWNGSVFCAVRSNSNQAAISANGLVWTSANMPSKESWKAITWNGVAFCAVTSSVPTGAAGATSANGVTWVARTMNNTNFADIVSWENRVVAPNSVYLSWSDDGGNTWTSDKEVSLGTYGDYTKRAVWRRLGLARQRIFRLRYSAAKSKVIVSGNLDAKACAH